VNNTNDESTILDSHDASPLDEQQQQSNTANANATAQAEQVLRGQRESRAERRSLFV
jgi:hypothetical protein